MGPSGSPGSQGICISRKAGKAGLAIFRKAKVSQPLTVVEGRIANRLDRRKRIRCGRTVPPVTETCGNTVARVTSRP